MSIPRQYSLIKFDYSNLPEEYHNLYPFEKDTVFIFFGEIPNMPGHCVVIESRTGVLHSGYHIENFVELTDDEV